MTTQLWLWSAGRRCGVSDDKERARENAEKAAIDGSCPALLELVVVGLDRNLESAYVHTDVAYRGAACDGRVSWLPGFPGGTISGVQAECRSR